MSAPADSIRIHPGNLTDALTLRRLTSLGRCTRIDGDAAGVLVVRNWPGLSSGEELLWAVLAWLNGQGDLPDAGTLASGLDTPSYAAVRGVVGETALVTR